MTDLDTITTEELVTELYLRSDAMVLYIFQDGAMTNDLSEVVSMSVLECGLNWAKAVRDALCDTIDKAEKDDETDIGEEFRERLLSRLDQWI